MIYKLLIIQIVFLSAMPIVYAATDSNIPTEAKWAASMAFAGVATVGAAIAGLRYLCGDSIAGLLGSVSGLIDQVKAAGNELISNSEAAGIRLVDHTGGVVEQKAEVVTAAVDERLTTITNVVNPVAHVQAMGNKASSFLKTVLNKANEALTSDNGFSSLEEETKLKLQTGLQKALADLEKTGNVETALEHMSPNEMEMLADYTVISREPSTAGSIEMSSVMEPFVSFYDFWVLTEIFFIFAFVCLICIVLLKCVSFVKSVFFLQIIILKEKCKSE